MLNRIINLIPGVLAAAAAFVGLLVMDFFGFQSNWLRFIVFVFVYIVVNIALDKAMTAYGKK